MKRTKQVTINLPHSVVEEAARVAESTERPDGLKQTLTATIREWVLRGMPKGSEDVNVIR